MPVFAVRKLQSNPKKTRDHSNRPPIAKYVVCEAYLFHNAIRSHEAVRWQAALLRNT